MSDSPSTSVASSSSQCKELIVSRRPGAGQDVFKFIADHQPADVNVLPAHSAETLARAFIAIPIFARVHTLTPRPDTASSRAAVLVADAASALQSSISICTQTQATLQEMWNDISKLGPDPPVATMTAVRKQASTMLIRIREVRDGLDAVYVHACKIAGELDKEIGLILAAEVQKRHWKTAVRVGSIGISVPSFVTAAVSAVYNTTSPTTSLILALISAGCGTCAAIGPYIAQSYWDGSTEGLQLANLQSVHVETVRMQYPLSLVMQWWRKIDQMFRGLRAASSSGVAKRIYEPMAVHLSKYTDEVQSILSSTSHHAQIENARERERGMV